MYVTHFTILFVHFK